MPPSPPGNGTGVTVGDVAAPVVAADPVALADPVAVAVAGVSPRAASRRAAPDPEHAARTRPAPTIDRFMARAYSRRSIHAFERD
jgi:hypothetical protein